MHKNEAYVAGAANNKPKPTKRKNISSQAVFLKKASDSKASGREDNEICSNKNRHTNILYFQWITTSCSAEALLQNTV